MATKPYESKYDLNQDGVIDEIDVSILQVYYGRVNPDDPKSVACDFDGNGKVDIIDYGQLASRAGTIGVPDSVKEASIVPTNVPWKWIGIGVGALILFSLLNKKRGKK